MFREANLSWAHFNEAHLGGANLEKANLYDADLRSANLVEAHLGGENLTDADLTATRMIDANLNARISLGAESMWRPGRPRTSQLTQGTIRYLGSSLSPDGTKVLMSSDAKGGYMNIALLDTTSKDVTWITDLKWEAYSGNSLLMVKPTATS